MRITIFPILFLLLTLLACDKNTEPTNFDYTYGKVQAVDKKLIQINYDTTISWNLEYDQHNNLVKISKHFPDTTIDEVYSYDNQDRLIRVHSNGYREEKYTYEDDKLVQKRIIYSDVSSNWVEPNYKYFYNELGQIIKAEGYAGDSLTSYFNYTYDKKGNVTNISEYAASGPRSLALTEKKMKYDNQPLPIKMPNISSVEISQVNNVTYSHYFNVIMSSLPPEHRSVFEYDTDGYPLKEIRTRLIQGEEQGVQEIFYVYE